MLVSFSSKVQPTEVNKENVHSTDMPDYPTDDESPVKGDANMARMGAAHKDSPGSWGFIKSVGQYLSTSFYW